MSAKWTKGELRAIVRDQDSGAALEVLQYLVERGPRVVDFDDDREPCEECGREPGNHHRWCGAVTEVTS